MSRAGVAGTFLLNDGFERFSLLLNPNDIAVGKVTTLSVSYLTFKTPDFSAEILTGVTRRAQLIRDNSRTSISTCTPARRPPQS